MPHAVCPFCTYHMPHPAAFFLLLPPAASLFGPCSTFLHAIPSPAHSAGRGTRRKQCSQDAALAQLPEKLSHAISFTLLDFSKIFTFSFFFFCALLSLFVLLSFVCLFGLVAKRCEENGKWIFHSIV